MSNLEVKFSPPNEYRLDSILEKINNYGKVYYNNIKYSFLKIKNLKKYNALLYTTSINFPSKNLL